MRCADASRLMDEMLDGRANSDQQAALLAHTAGCVACRAEWSTIQQVDQLLVAAPRVSPPTHFTAKVMSRLPRRRLNQNPWAGALALFAGSLALLVFALVSLLGVGLSAEAPGLVEIGGVGLLQVGDTLVSWIQAGWGIRQVVLSLVPAGVIALYALLSLVALVIWVGLVTGIQGTLRPAGLREV
ncbi:MAG: hypothetical protein MAG451_01134 [Anaerolineales bacterium]|nr:hypothetical protein [Anaerolineales bacterium]